MAVKTGNARVWTIPDMIAKRKQRWEQGYPEKGIQPHDIAYDEVVVDAAVREILGDTHTPPNAALVAELNERPHLLIELAFTVVDKNRQTVPFFLNEAQKEFIRIYEEHGGGVPYLILKGRQLGFTTVITAIQYANAIKLRNFSGLTLADTAENVSAIFNDKARSMHQRLHPRLKPSEKYNSKRELYFDKLGSSWRTAVATADVGRSKTLNFVHLSEAAFFSCTLGDLQAGLLQACTADAVVIYESTANGFGEFKELWDSGTCINLFFAWWLAPEYRSTDYGELERAERGEGDAWLIERVRLLFEMGLDRRQVAWYCKKYAGYLDKSLIRQEYPCTPEEAFIASGDCVFDVEALTQQLLRVGALRPRVGEFVYRRIKTQIKDARGEVIGEEWELCDVEFVDKPGGLIRIHEEPLVKTDKQGHVTHRAPYVLGGDTAGTGEDYFTGKIVSNMTGRTAATVQIQRIDEDVYAEQMLCLARMYHDALIGIETNYSRQPMRLIAQEYRYPKIYMRERFDKTYNETAQVPGFETTPTTRPIIIAGLVRALREDPAMEPDVPTLKELLTFVKKENGRQEAVEGGHDDLVLALAIAHQIRGQQVTDWMAVEPERDPFYEKYFGGNRGGNMAYFDDGADVGSYDGGGNDYGSGGGLGDYGGWDDI
ncbi:MAG: hypothetical protein E7645_00865 [Ruminococcaceae bacterium]|nr:hypothetical protein [Oscillospiraceae bacterium]